MSELSLEEVKTLVQQPKGLFVSIYMPVNTTTVDLHSEAELGDEDLLDTAAIHTILNGGTVYAVEPEKVPDDAPLAAVFRY